MQRVFEAVYDGEVLRPQEPVDLEPNARYWVTIEVAAPTDGAHPAERPLLRYLALARELDLPADLAEQHDHYLYGTPKR